VKRDPWLPVAAVVAVILAAIICGLLGYEFYVLLTVRP
jgi:hypothetical protein